MPSARRFDTGLKSWVGAVADRQPAPTSREDPADLSALPNVRKRVPFGESEAGSLPIAGARHGLRSAFVMTDLLRDALRKAPSIRGVAKETGHDHASLLRFERGDSSLRLDLADRLADCFGIECRQGRRRKDG